MRMNLSQGINMRTICTPHASKLKRSVRSRSSTPRIAALAACAGFAAANVDASSALPADNRTGVVTGREGVLNLRTGDVDLSALPDLLAHDTFPVGTARAVIRLDGPLTAARETALTAAGLTLRGYLPTNTFIADLNAATPPTPPALKNLGFVISAHEYQRVWKIDPALNQPARVWHSDDRLQLAAAGRLAASIWLFEGADPAATRAALLAMNTVVMRESEEVGPGVRIAVTLSADAASAIADLADVQFIEALPEYDLRSNSTIRWTIQSGVASLTPLYTRGLTGAGQVIGVIDGGLSTTHCSFVDSTNPIGPTHRKILAYNIPVSYNLHGTHVACTAAGDGGNNSDTRGVAYNAKIVYNFYPDVNETSNYQRYNLHNMQGAFIHTNSWGTDATREYDGGCRGIDAFLHDHEDNLIVHAVSDGGLVTNPENAKNSLAVSASLNGTSANQYCDGGSGPTQDGRRKPEVMAPGCSILSAGGNGGCLTTALSGTSMATPAVGGLAILTRQYYINGFYPGGAANASNSLIPSGALMKATLVNCAQDMTNVSGYPSDQEGWGRVVADSTLFFTGDARGLFIRDVLNTSAAALHGGEEYQIDVSVASPTLPLRFTMVYTDAPAQVNAVLTPVNNLDLVATSPDGSEYKGNVFSGGFSTTGGAADALNNTEQVHIASPLAGRWHVRIVGAAVNSGAQGFALVVTGGGVELAPCIGDFNIDGGIDGQDVEAFFTAWTAGDMRADINADGGVDGADVETFFSAWSGGC